MSIVTITSFNTKGREDLFGVTNVFEGDFRNAEQVYLSEIEEAKEDGFVVETENESLYSRNCVLKDGNDYCVISFLKRMYR